MTLTKLPDAAIERIVRPHLNSIDSWETLHPDADLAKVGLDAMASIDVLVQFEEELGITIPDSVVAGDSFSSLRGIRALLDRLNEGA